jgi:glycosyltransferase involved in cell wall biosynthesis
LIGQTLRSLLNQTLPADEIIVVDDGSNDGTEEAAWAAFHRWESESRVLETARGEAEGNVGTWEGGKLPEFKVIRQENAGPGAARNRGFAESKGEFIHFFDSDDIAAPNKHEVQVRALQESGADIAYGPWVKGYIREHGAWSGELGVGTDGGEQGAGSRERGAQSGEHAEKRYSFEPEEHVLQQRGLPKGDLIKELLTRWSVVPHACMFRRSIVETVGGFPKELFGTEDQMMFLRCLLAGARLVHTPETIEFYRLGDSGKITAPGPAQRRHAEEWAKFLELALKGCLSAAIDPMSWLGFRWRVWAADEEVRKLCGKKQTKAPNKQIEPFFMRRLVYPFITKAYKWSGGARLRLMGTRHLAAFQTGPLTAAQRSLFPSI